MLEQTGTPESPARIVNVSSDAHRGARLDFEDMQLEERYSGYGAYGRAKLAMIMFTYDLARNLREKGSPVTVNALHPGFVNSGFGRDQKGFLGVLARVILFLGRPLGKSPESGARTTIMLAASEELDGVSGKYFADEKEAESNPASLEESDWPRLRRITEELVGLRVRA